MKWFGEPWPRAEWRAAVCSSDLDRVEVPIGRPCLFCPTPIDADARGVMMPTMTRDNLFTFSPVHLRCQLANVLGDGFADTVMKEMQR